MRASIGAAVLLVLPLLANAQDQPELREILNRLEKLERQNRELAEEVRSLREQLAKGQAAGAGENAVSEPPVEERIAVQERRIEEHEQAKVSTEHKLPVTLTGTILFNAYLNGRHATDSQYPTTAALNAGVVSAGGSFRQSILGFRYDGPTYAGAKIGGVLFLDLWAGTGTSLNTLMRLRVASIDMAWKNTTLTFGQDKPIIAPREPESLAQMGVSPLTSAGNLWLWQPQVKLEHRLGFGEHAGLKAQVGVYETNEGAGLNSEYQDSTARGRPGYEGRFEFWKSSGARRVEIAPGFHYSTSQVDGYSLPSRIFSLDWLIRPLPALDFSGAFFSGRNVGVLGALRQGIVVVGPDQFRTVKAIGGWGQLTVRATPRLTFNMFGGQHDSRNRDLLSGNVAKNLVYAGNAMYRLGPNVIASFEASRTRTTYLGIGNRFNPHYDLALAYMF